jgi:hypothetical protein
VKLSSCHFFVSETFKVLALFNNTRKWKVFFTTNPGLGCELQNEDKGWNNGYRSSTIETQKVAKSEIRTDAATSRERFGTESRAQWLRRW